MPEETTTRKRPEREKLPEFPIISRSSPNSIEEIGAIVEHEELETRAENHIESRIKELTDALDTAMTRYYHSQRPDLDETYRLGEPRIRVQSRGKKLEVSIDEYEDHILLSAKMTPKGLRTRFRIEGGFNRRRLDVKSWGESSLADAYYSAIAAGIAVGVAAGIGAIGLIEQHIAHYIAQAAAISSTLVLTPLSTSYLATRAVQFFDKERPRRPQVCDEWHDIDDLPRILSHDVAMQAEVLEELKQVPQYLKWADEQREKRETDAQNKKKQALKKALDI